MRRTPQVKKHKGGGSSNRKVPATLGTRDFAPQRVEPSVQPQQVERTVKVAKKLRLDAALVAGSFAITPAALANAVPGGLSYWNSMQVERIDVYGPDQATLSGAGITLTVQPVSSFSQPPFVVSDDGTFGSERARVGVRLGLLDRARWFGVADTTPLATVSSGLQTSAIIVYASVQLISPA